MISHTKGPWYIANGVQVRSMRDQIAKVWCMRGDEWKANAALIAAAPELLEALEEMCSEFRGYDLPYGSYAYAKAISAINKARSAS